MPKSTKSVRLNQTMRNEIYCAVAEQFDDNARKENPTYQNEEELNASLTDIALRKWLKVNQKKLKASNTYGKAVAPTGGVKSQNLYLDISVPGQFRSSLKITIGAWYDDDYDDDEDKNDNIIVKLQKDLAKKYPTLMPSVIHYLERHVILTEEDPGVAKILTTLQENRKIGERKKELMGNVSGILQQANSTGQLIEIWPEVEQFIPSYILDPSRGITLPAVRLEDLNSKLGLN